MRKFIPMLALAALLQSCAALPAIKSAFDIGVELCQLWYSQHPAAVAKAGISIKDICSIAEVNAPFVDTVLTSNGTAGAVSQQALEQHISAAHK